MTANRTDTGAPLDPVLWERVERAFLALEHVPADERDAAIASHAAGDASLARILRRMLGAAEHAPARIGDAIARAADAVAAIAPGSWIGRRVGSYVVLREIGRGGMGLVFEAARADAAFDKRVALKVAPDWRGGDDSAARFRAERQILAGLEHPNIARLLDGGTEDGVPYFAMELVDGEPITAYCNRHGLDLDARLRLFIDVCLAVEYAHDHLVVHRDIKPANILVTAGGVPKLLDFGIAKVLGGRAADATLTAVTAWTPAYVSPEQVRGWPITVRTDVYSLGLVLYELVCESRARSTETTADASLVAALSEAALDAPSARLRAAGRRDLARRVAGDIDTITLTAVSHAPDERYRSVAELRDDITRVLTNRPIRARMASPLHRARKFVARHAVAVTAVAIAATLAVAGLVSALNEGRKADRRFQQVRALANTFVTDVHDRIAMLPGSTEARHAIVQTALTYLESLRADVGTDAALAVELASAYEKVGSAQGLPTGPNLGNTEGALASYDTGIALLQPFASQENAARQTVSLLNLRGVVRRARGDVDGAIADLDEGVAIGRRLLAARPDDIATMDVLGSIVADRGRAAFERRDFGAAERDGTDAMALAERLVAAAPQNSLHRNSLAAAHLAVGTAQLGAGRLTDAATHYRESTTIREALVHEHPDNAAYRRALAIGYGTLGDVLGYRPDNLGDTDGAVTAFTKAAALIEQARAEDPKDRRALYDLANVHVRLGRVYANAQPARMDDALSALERATSNVDSLLAEDPEVLTYRYLRFVVLRDKGYALARIGRRTAAITALEDAAKVGAALRGGPNDATVADAMTVIATRLDELRLAR